jgi:hypothetical protein
MRRTLKILVVALPVLSVIYILVANPFNFFTKKSSRFSEEKFLSVKSGDSIAQVIDVLGEPLYIKEVEDRFADCLGCKVYYFMGSPPSWLIFFKEAWIMVGPDGKVRWTILHLEP